MSKDVFLKLAVFGEGGVGKTSLVNAFMGKEVPRDYSPTFNSKVSKKDYIFKKVGVVFKLNIWDVGGNRAINPNINRAFFTGVDLALIVFDLTRPNETLKLYKKTFLDVLSRYSEEPLTLIVGNKLDKLTLTKDFKDTIKKYLGEKSRFSLVSATAELNVNNCFELLFHTFLKKTEILLPDLVPENSSTEFLEIIGKNEQELRNQLVNLATIKSKYNKLKSKIKTSDEEPSEKTKEEKYYEFIQQELLKITNQKQAIRDNFFKVITDLEKNINQLIKQNIKAAPELVEKLKTILESSLNGCVVKKEKLIRLNREENELTIIGLKAYKSKVEEIEVEVKSKPEDFKAKIEELKEEPQIISSIDKEDKPKTLVKVESIPPKVVEENLEASPPKVLEVHLENSTKQKSSSLKVNEVKFEPQIISLNDKEVKSKKAIEEEAHSLKTKESYELEVLKITSSPVKVKEVKVEKVPKAAPPPKKVKDVKIEKVAKVALSPKKVKDVKIGKVPKAVPSPVKVKDVKVEKVAKVAPSPVKVKDVKVEKVAKAPPSLKKVKDVKVEKVPKAAPPPKKVKEVKAEKIIGSKPSLPKLKRVKIGSSPIKKDPKIELYNIYERENPGKRAVYRGKETKGFLAWKEQSKNHNKN